MKTGKQFLALTLGLLLVLGLFAGCQQEKATATEPVHRARHRACHRSTHRGSHRRAHRGPHGGHRACHGA